MAMSTTAWAVILYSLRVTISYKYRPDQQYNQIDLFAHTQHTFVGDRAAAVHTDIVQIVCLWEWSIVFYTIRPH